MDKFKYLCSPYSHKDPGIREARYRSALQCLAHYTANSEVLYSPVVHNHPVASQFVMPEGWEFWSKFDIPFLKASAEVWILTIDGWRESVGIKNEVEIAKGLHLPISFVNENGVGNYWQWETTYADFERLVRA